MNPFVLLGIGLFLIFLEFYLPGAIMGICGTLLVLMSIFLFASTTDSSILTLVYVVGSGVCVGLLIKFAIWRIKHAKPDFSIYSDSSQKDYVASTYDKSAIGKKGVVLSDLKPGGYIVIDGKQHQAISLSGYLSRGTEVTILSGDGESLQVIKETENNFPTPKEEHKEPKL